MIQGHPRPTTQVSLFSRVGLSRLLPPRNDHPHLVSASARQPASHTCKRSDISNEITSSTPWSNTFLIARTKPIHMHILPAANVQLHSPLPSSRPHRFGTGYLRHASNAKARDAARKSKYKMHVLQSRLTRVYITPGLRGSISCNAGIGESAPDPTHWVSSLTGKTRCFFRTLIPGVSLGSAGLRGGLGVGYP
jgi:hypothetical protein